ncbi:hypothetical protein H2200_010652 [Cladophialophora chaetospira]|uniref:Uncharacterized protein n=1 Tax=Cladophialophora chaetospira TaxID=386627 RepID=A0AA38X0I3_9EURO|nr:hypothetical protein H2200_010652 [Cladophialophora chaetospira]
MARTKQPPYTYRMAMERVGAKRVRIEEPEEESLDQGVEPAVASRPTARTSPGYEALIAQKRELQAKTEDLEAQIKELKKSHIEKEGLQLWALRRQLPQVLQSLYNELDPPNDQARDRLANQATTIQEQRQTIVEQKETIKQRDQTNLEQQQIITGQGQRLFELNNQPVDNAGQDLQNGIDRARKTDKQIIANQKAVIVGLLAKAEAAKLPNEELRNDAQEEKAIELSEKINAAHQAWLFLAPYKNHALPLWRCDKLQGGDSMD